MQKKKWHFGEKNRKQCQIGEWEKRNYENWKECVLRRGKATERRKKMKSRGREHLFLFYFIYIYSIKKIKEKRKCKTLTKLDVNRLIRFGCMDRHSGHFHVIG